MKQIIAELERKNPYSIKYVDGPESKNQVKRRKAQSQGYEKCLSMLSSIVARDSENKLGEKLDFMAGAYGITHKHVNGHHVKLYHEEYDGWFDWYHTTGTLIANRDGGTANLGKITKDEDVALKINKHIYGK